MVLINTPIMLLLFPELSTIRDFPLKETPEPVHVVNFRSAKAASEDWVSKRETRKERKKERV